MSQTSITMTKSKANTLANIEKLKTSVFYSSPFILIDFDLIDHLRNGQMDQARLAIRLKPDLQRLFASTKKHGLDLSFAIRSSAANEDSDLASFAGQYQTRLSIKPQDLIKNIYAMAVDQDYNRQANLTIYRTKIASKPSQAAETEAKRLEEKLSLIVQAMVPADIAGVAFSRDPVRSHDAMLIVSTTGLGEKLMAGTIDGEHAWIQANGIIAREKIAASEIQILSDQRLRQVERAVKALQQGLNMPDIDIEWAFAGKKLYILQARPITTPRIRQSMLDVTIYEGSNIQESYPGVTTPMTFSFIKRSYAGVYRSFCTLMGVRLQASHDAIFADLLAQKDGVVYYNLNNWYRLIGLLPAYRSTRPKMEKMMGINAPDKPLLNVDEFAGRTGPLDIVRCLAAMTISFINLKKECVAFHNRCQAAIEQVDALMTEPPDIPSALKLYKDLERGLIDNFKAPIANDFFAMLAFGVLSDRCGKDDKTRLYDALLPHGGVASAKPPTLLATIRSAIAAQGYEFCSRFVDTQTSDEERLQMIKGIPLAQKAYDIFIRDYGDRTIGELKLETITYRENPALLLRVISQLLVNDDIDNDCKNTNSQKEPLTFSDPATRWLAGLTAKLLANRENLRLRRSQVFGMVRRILLLVGKELFVRGHLDDPRDIFFLDIDYLIDCVDQDKLHTAKERAAIAKDLYAKQTQAAVSHPPARRLVFKDSQLLPEQCTSHINTGHANRVLSGLGASRGRVSGRACVINEPQTQTMAGYDILVANSTDPGWIVHFASSKGIVVDHGSLLSHTAIVARELGIPAVVSAHNASRQIKTGDTIEIDGSTGMVTILDTEEESNEYKSDQVLAMLGGH
ncbi:MAG: hypothetical protein J0H83_04700 [Candidatus Melainabacteria bacterium]|jgi:rifampicin phosphotransferase|nr:hypothetical protein [Candidatus Melainabacteria bacterium]MBX9672789.1 hypothetical protein [Candidatus Obscuribacterales bacterium]